MARSVRYLTETAALPAERGIGLVVLKQGTGTATPAGRFTFHVLAVMDEMLAGLIAEGTREGLESARARGRAGGRKPKLTARQAVVARGMYGLAAVLVIWVASAIINVVRAACSRTQ